MSLELSCSFATSPESHEHMRIAESLGYRRAFFYDSPALYPDVWVQLCRAAERTQHIGLGPGVLVPSLRHPTVNAAAIATLVSIAGPGRVAVGIGSGFTGRLTLGLAAEVVDAAQVPHGSQPVNRPAKNPCGHDSVSAGRLPVGFVLDL